ncbi:MAG: hypothetical protein ACREXW_18075 [Gammaproteobacteria bacterium]
MGNATKQIFLSYSGEDAFEAGLLQFALENLLSDLGAQVWTFQRDQQTNQKGIASSLKDKIRDSRSGVFLVSPFTLDYGATQWMELAYLDAYEVPTYILLHHVTFQDLKSRERGIPPLLLESQCNPAINWKLIASDIRGDWVGRPRRPI